MEQRGDLIAKTAPEARELLRVLAEQGIDAYLVGGCVRDLLRGVAPADYDLTATAQPQELMELFGAAAHPTGIAHGTVTVVFEGRAFEITTMRCDGIYTDARHPANVSFTKNICEDLARRDFTVNAIALSLKGELIDPYGGRGDIERGVLRCVGEPRRRFAEDALRILRLLRFAAVLGFSVEEETALAARELAPQLEKIASERVYEELRRTLLGDNAAKVLLDYGEIFAVVLPEIAPCIGFDQRNAHHCFDVWEHTARSVGAVGKDEVLRWTMLFHDLGKPDTFTLDEEGVGHFYDHTLRSAELAADIMARLHFPRSVADAVKGQLACFDDYFPPERGQIHRKMAQLGRESMGRLLATKLADNAAKAPEGLERAQSPWIAAQEIYHTLLEENVCCSIGELAIGGEALGKIGFRTREIGAALERLLEEVSLEKIDNDAAVLTRRAERLWRSGWRGEKER